MAPFRNWDSTVTISRFSWRKVSSIEYGNKNNLWNLQFLLINKGVYNYANDEGC